MGGGILSIVKLVSRVEGRCWAEGGREGGWVGGEVVSDAVFLFVQNDPVRVCFFFLQGWCLRYIEMLLSCFTPGCG